MKRLSGRVRRYLIIGISVYVFELMVIWLGELAGLSAVMAVALAFISGTLLSFFLQKLVTFKDKRMHHKVVGLQLLATIALVVFNFLFTILLTAALEDLLPAVVVRTIALGITTIWNFYLYKTHIFKGGKTLKANSKKAIIRPISITSDQKQSLIAIAVSLAVLGVALSAGQITHVTKEKPHRPPAPSLSSKERRLLGASVRQMRQKLAVSDECRKKTALQIVAHQDDDLLFMNPDVANDISRGKCVVTIFVTAGDIGRDSTYMLGRELGAKTAYANMAGSPEAPWVDMPITFDKGNVAHISQLQGNGKIMLIFLRLHDGNVGGGGFANRATSLQLLLSQNKTISTLEGGATYTRDQLTRLITSFLATLKPSTIRTHEREASRTQGDHSDHVATGDLVLQATKQYRHYSNNRHKPSVWGYMGYPLRSKPANLSASEESNKRNLFLIYTPYDDAICPGGVCSGGTDSYEAYLSRLYKRQLTIR